MISGKLNLHMGNIRKARTVKILSKTYGFPDGIIVFFVQNTVKGILQNFQGIKK